MPSDSGLVNNDEKNEEHTEEEKETERADGDDKKGEETVKNGGSVEKKKSAKGGIIHILDLPCSLQKRLSEPTLHLVTADVICICYPAPDVEG